MIRKCLLAPVLSVLLAGCVEGVDLGSRNALWSIEGQLPSAVLSGKPRSPVKLEYRLTAYELGWFDLDISALGTIEVRRYVVSVDSVHKSGKDLLVERSNPLKDGSRLGFFREEGFERLILDVEYESGTKVRRQSFSIPINQAKYKPPKTCIDPPCYTDAELR